MMMRNFVWIAALCCALQSTAPVAHGEAASNEVKLFIGINQNQLDSGSDAQVRAFVVAQKLIDSLWDLLPTKVRDGARRGDVASWETSEDRRKLEQLGFTHYVIAEPLSVTAANTAALEIKWYVGMFSSDDNRALDGWLRNKSDEPEYVVFIPKLTEKAPNKPAYEEAELKRKKSGAQEKKDWERVTPESIAEQLIKILQHIFPEMRSRNEYLVQCIDDALKSPVVDSKILMMLLSAKLEAAGWQPTLLLRRPHAEEICSDTDGKYKAKSIYRFEDAHFLINGYLVLKSGRAGSSIKVDDRTAEKRKEYVVRAKDSTSSSVWLDDFCMHAQEFNDVDAVKTLADYIHKYGFKARSAFPSDGGWKC